MKQVPKMLFLSVLKNITIQSLLYFFAFLSFGVGDGVTGAYIMNARDPYIESNPIIRYLFMTRGYEGMLLIKVLFTLVVLLTILRIQRQYGGNVYWTVNMTLIALISLGLIGVYFNIGALNGIKPLAQDKILFIYAILALIFIETGDFIDRRFARKL